MGIPKGSTPRSSGRLREKAQKKFEMPTRDKVLGKIKTTPGKSYEQYKPRKLINNFVKERNTYNNRDDPLEMTDDEEGFSDFIVENEPSSFESRGKNKKRKKSRSKSQQSSESSSESISDFIVEDDFEEPPPSRLRRSRKSTKLAVKAEYSSESSELDNEEITSDFSEECEESDNQRTKNSPKRVKRMLSSSDSDLDESNGVTPSRRSNRISRQPKKKFEKPNKKKAWENILEREPDLRQTVDNDDVNDFVVGDEEVGEEASDSETNVWTNGDEDGDISEEDTADGGSPQQDDKSNSCKNTGETDPPQSLGDELIRTDESLSGKQEDIENKSEVKNLDTPLCSSVSKETDLIKSGNQSDDCESDSECTSVGRKFRSKVHHRRQITKVLDSDESESDDEKINDTFVGRSRRRTSTNLNFGGDSDDSDSDGRGGGGEKKGEEMREDEEDKGGTK